MTLLLKFVVVMEGVVYGAWVGMYLRPLFKHQLLLGRLLNERREHVKALNRWVVYGAWVGVYLRPLFKHQFLLGRLLNEKREHGKALNRCLIFLCNSLMRSVGCKGALKKKLMHYQA